MTFAEKAIKYFFNLIKPTTLPSSIEVMNPYVSKEIKRVISHFYKKFYADENKRIFIVGINPGRFGGGVTGIAFTDPINLEQHCGIKNDFYKRPELSSRFVYSVLEAYGGVHKFYSKYFLTALYPLALFRDGKNYNYYDSPEIYRSLKKDIVCSLQSQIEFGADNKVVFCLGKKNEYYLKEINSEINFFRKIITLEHPRYIMQYKLKSVNSYIKKYLDSFANVESF
ncbi:MAG: uracil-DNA glycosylase family protein [bacterium]